MTWVWPVPRPKRSEPRPSDDIGFYPRTNETATTHMIMINSSGQKPAYLTAAVVSLVKGLVIQLRPAHQFTLET